MRWHSCCKNWIAFLLTTVWPLFCLAGDVSCGNDIRAIKFLGTVDCYQYPDAQTVLMNALENDPREPVRYAAVRALEQQLQRGQEPRQVGGGWRQVPDPEIMTQICRNFNWQCPLTMAEVAERYQSRQQAERRLPRRQAKYIWHDCVTKELIALLARTAYEKDEYDCFVEPSERVRYRAEQALGLCKGCRASVSLQATTPSSPPSPTTAPDQTTSPEEQAPVQQPFTPESLSTPAPSVSSYTQNFVPFTGRADITNRLNIFDNMNAQPVTRVWTGYQYVGSQNNGVLQSGNTNELFTLLNTASGRATFEQVTGFGRQPGQPSVDPNDPASASILRRQFLVQNGGRSQNYLNLPSTNLYRWGFEYAFTPDFSVTAIAQYVNPINGASLEQPNTFSNPSVQLKHVLYRDDANVWSGVFNVQPEIPKPGFAINEKTTRFTMGLLSFNNLTDRTFLQSAMDVSVPSNNGQVIVGDFALAAGWWAYKHESLESWYRGEPPRNWLLGVVPLFEVLGSQVFGSNLVIGQYGLGSNTAVMAPGTFNGQSPPNNQIIFPEGLPGAGRPFTNTAFVFRQPNTIIDLTVGGTFLLKNKFVLSSGFSFPVTTGKSRASEFTATLNRLF